MWRAHRIVALSPHTDDSELGCGGFLARALEEGADVWVLAYSSAAESLPPGAPRDTLRHECRKALGRLGVPPDQVILRDYPVRRFAEHRQSILEEMVALRRELAPDLVLLPASTDVHQDHQVIHAEGVRAFKETTIFGYELPWNHIAFRCQAYAALERRHLERKERALAAYRSQVELGRPYFAPGFAEALARLRGTQVKTELAEAFEVVRLRL